MKTFDSLTDALNHYRTEGYTVDFNLAFDKLICQSTGVCLVPSEFEIVGTIRFENSTDPDEESILYIVESKSGDMKGTMVSAYGTYADEISKELLDKLSFHNQAPGL